MYHISMHLDISCDIKRLLQLKIAKKNCNHGWRRHYGASHSYTKQWHIRHGSKPIPGWPKNSPALISIESVVSNDAVSKQRAMSVGGVKRTALKVLRKILLSCFKSLYKSQPRRMKALVDAHGDHTKY